MSDSLHRLVQASPVLMNHVLVHLGKGIPRTARNAYWFKRIDIVRRATTEELARALWERSRAKLQLEESLNDAGAGMFTPGSAGDLLREIGHDSEEALRAKLRDQHLLVRLVAVEAVAQRRLRLEGDLIERLDDHSEEVSQAAHKAFVQLARGLDFGPQPLAQAAARRRAVEQWKSWLALQQHYASPQLRTAAFDVLATEKDVLAGQPWANEAEDPEVVKLRDGLIQAKAERQAELLRQLRDAKGVVHTEALAQAIPHLPRKIQPQAREALEDRLTRMTVGTLKDKLEEDDEEIRRAAIRACARKRARERVPELIELLTDRQGVIVLAAHAALRDLTGTDFGPPANAGREQISRAQAAWRRWWTEQQGR